jgi:AcrR family transcriptional regulator
MNDSYLEASSLRRLPKQARSQQKVNRILDAAAEIFLEVGYSEATTHMIAARANTAVGSLYQFFADKQAIFQALELRHIDQGRSLGKNIFAPEKAKLPLEEFVEQMVEQCVQFFELPASRAIFMQYFTNPSLFQHIDDSFTQEFVKLLSGILLQMNPALSSQKCYLFADVCMQCFNTMMLKAIQSDAYYRQSLLKQTKELLIVYLYPHIKASQTR